MGTSIKWPAAPAAWIPKGDFVLFYTSIKWPGRFKVPDIVIQMKVKGWQWGNTFSAVSNKNNHKIKSCSILVCLYSTRASVGSTDMSCVHAIFSLAFVNVMDGTITIIVLFLHFRLYLHLINGKLGPVHHCTRVNIY